MSRPIKFRVWDGAHKTYLYSDAYIMFWARSKNPLKKAEQFTGLLDKNGDKIYEGDILQSANVDHAPVAVVVYVDYEARFAPCEIENYLIGKRDGDLFNQPGEPWMLHECSVIGNIHENPDLLK